MLPDLLTHLEAEFQRVAPLTKWGREPHRDFFIQEMRYALWSLHVEQPSAAQSLFTQSYTAIVQWAAQQAHRFFQREEYRELDPLPDKDGAMGEIEYRSLTERQRGTVRLTPAQRERIGKNIRQAAPLSPEDVLSIDAGDWRSVLYALAHKGVIDHDTAAALILDLEQHLPQPDIMRLLLASYSRAEIERMGHSERRIRRTFRALSTYLLS